MKSLPTISVTTFWDVKIQEKEYAESFEWIILRVFDRGTLDEVFQIINYYGFDFVRNVLIDTTDNLPNHAILLARAIFKINYSDFKCSKKKMSHPN